LRAGGAVDEERREGAPDLGESVLLGFDGCRFDFAFGDLVLPMVKVRVAVPEKTLPAVSLTPLMEMV